MKLTSRIILVACTALCCRTAVSAANPGALDGRWRITSVGGHKAAGETIPYLDFNTADSRIYGSNGCNYINADFTTSTASRLRISNLLSTKMACDDAPYQTAINLALEAVQTYAIVHHGQEYTLELRDSRGTRLMTLNRHDMSFIDGVWRVERIEGYVNSIPEIGLVIDVSESKLHGNTDCNIINGTIDTNSNKRNFIQFLDIATTRAACEEDVMRVETALLVALESTESVRQISTDKIELLSYTNEPLMRLVRITDNLRR